MAEDRERAIASILEQGRRTRRPTPRWMWIVAGGIGLLCATGFVIALATTSSPSTTMLRPEPVAAPERVSGFGTGIAIGSAVGIAIGIGVGVSVARQGRAHSSRNSP